jgi:hypothetical protein
VGPAGIALAVGLVWWAISSAQSNADQLEARQESLKEYSGRIRTVSEAIGPAAAEMNAVPPTAEEGGVVDLAKSSERWAKAFTDAQGPLVEILPPSQTLGRVNGLFQQALQLYDSAARTFGLAPKAEGKVRDDLLARAAAQRDQATAIWASAVAFVDAARASAEMDASGLTPPGAQPEGDPTQPTELPTGLPTEGGG